MPFTLQNTRPGQCDKGKVKFNETITASESLPFLLDGLAPVSMTVIPIGGSTGKIQTTTYPRSMVEAGTAVWTDWPPGVVAAAATAILDSGVTAAKLVLSTGASIGWNLVG